MKTIQLSLQIADDITSIDQLEQYIDHLGQQIKRQLFTNMLTQLRQSKSQSDSTPSTCPSCKKTETIAWGNRPRVLKTVFGQVHFHLPRQKCQPCQHTFSLSMPGLELSGNNIISELRKIAILCGSSWSFRQAANLLLQLTVGLSSVSATSAGCVPMKLELSAYRIRLSMIKWNGKP